MGVQLKHSLEEISFKRKQSFDLNKLLKSLTAESQGAVEVLVELMDKTKNKDDKLRASAAETLLKLQIQVSDMKNRDEVQRLLAEVKYGPRTLVQDGGDDDTPLLDFNVIVE